MNYKELTQRFRNGGLTDAELAMKQKEELAQRALQGDVNAKAALENDGNVSYTIDDETTKEKYIITKEKTPEEEKEQAMATQQEDWAVKAKRERELEK